MGCTLGLLVLASVPAQAGTITAAATRTVLTPTESLNWGTVLDDFVSKASPYALTSTLGLGVTASLTGGFTVFKQNGAAFTGNFTDGDILLSTFSVNGPVAIAFDAPIRGVGFNIVHENFGNFTGTMNYYGAGNVLFGTTSVNGTSSSANDGSAPFLGGFSSLKDIVRVEVSVNTVGGSTALAINQLSLNTAISPIPEPTTGLLMALGLGAGLLRRGWRAHAAA